MQMATRMSTHPGSFCFANNPVLLRSFAGCEPIAHHPSNQTIRRSWTHYRPATTAQGYCCGQGCAAVGDWTADEGRVPGERSVVASTPVGGHCCLRWTREGIVPSSRKRQRIDRNDVDLLEECLPYSCRQV